jgi:hypothetical protein
VSGGEAEEVMKRKKVKYDRKERDRTNLHKNEKLQI